MFLEHGKRRTRRVHPNERLYQPINTGGLEYNFEPGVTTSTPDHSPQTQFFRLGGTCRTTVRVV